MSDLFNGGMAGTMEPSDMPWWAVIALVAVVAALLAAVLIASRRRRRRILGWFVATIAFFGAVAGILTFFGIRAPTVVAPESSELAIAKYCRNKR